MGGKIILKASSLLLCTAFALFGTNIPYGNIIIGNAGDISCSETIEKNEGTSINTDSQDEENNKNENIAPQAKETDGENNPDNRNEGYITPDPSAEATQQTPLPETTANAPETEKEEVLISVYISGIAETRIIPLEKFIVGSLAAEMSYNSEREALKAQAVAIRTYCLHKSTYRNPSHPDAAVCSSSSHCLGYYSDEDLYDMYGQEKGDEIIWLLSDIVSECDGEYLSYDGKYVNAMFHDGSYSTTESYADLYGRDIPYLQSVISPEEAYVYTLSLSAEEFISRVSSCGSPDWFSPPIGKIELFEQSGRVKNITVFGITVSGNNMRFLLGLTSTCFTVKQECGRIVFTSYGNGHGIGLSQRGAKAYAKSGASYYEILMHYYPGTTLEKQ